MLIHINSNPKNPMNTPTSPPPLREQIADFVRRELIGPDPQPASAQANGEESLIGDAPRMRYGAGILFPQTALLDDALIAAPDEVNLENGEQPADEDAPPPQSRADYAPRAAEQRLDDADEPDEMVSLSNAFLPAAMGFSCVVEVGENGLVAHVKAATYASREVKRIGKDGREYSNRYWDRKPFEIAVALPADKLLGATVRNEELPVGTENLCVRVLSRPFGDAPNLRLLTLALVNTNHSASGERIENERCYFQVEMKLVAADGSAAFREYPDATLAPDDEECSLALLYRHRVTYGIGHGCAADWNEIKATGRADAVWCDVLPLHEIKPIKPNIFADLPLAMFDLCDRGDDANLEPMLRGLCDRYEDWIADNESEVMALSGNMGDAARRHLEHCRKCLARMRGGVEALGENEQVRRAFRLANRAMLQQQLHYALGTKAEFKRAWNYENGSWNIAPPAWPDIENPGGKGTWYPFQLAFLLMNLRSLSDESEPERDIVDLIWFPTGGGKTEAYLGLTAFTIILRRLRHPNDAGTSVLMRYTLRLLTAQQFQRASSLICALEKMRCEGDIPGEARICAGLWAGNGLTPNSKKSARQSLEQLQKGEIKENPFVMPVCPWCGAPMGRVESNGKADVQGYEERERNGARTVVLRCADARCDFGGGDNTLPLCVIDEDLYDAPPTLLLGTVDKFAMLTWRPQARSFFGLDEGGRAPDLIIQDELHLISGPLGSMVGHYETVISELCARYDDDGNRVSAPKIIASTATISRAGEQCHGLWNCGVENVFQFPPQLLRAGDSFFAFEDEESAGRLYMGVHASALSSHVTAQIRVMAALLQAPISAQIGHARERDPYWTLIGYYNSLRELGHAATLLGADIREYLNAMWLRLGIEKPADETQPDLRRWINRDLELTSRIPSGQIPDLLQQLFTVYDGDDGEGDRPVDVALATNMISVGVDVPRLGLMTVAGQPKTTAEYIQATSRVGREQPGLVVTIYNTGKPRDRSHYEHFHSYHDAVYRAVEPTSVTPFSSPVRDRALHAVVATLVRYLGDEANRERPAPTPDDDFWDFVRDVISERVEGVDAPEREATMKYLDELIARWMRVAPPVYGGWGLPDVQVPLLHPAGSVPAPQWIGKSWATPSSMRDVDASCEARVLGQYPQPPAEVLKESS